MTLPLWLFALVWLAAWAVCWFPLARIVRVVPIVDSWTAHECAQARYADGRVDYFDGPKAGKPFPPRFWPNRWRARAPYLATACAFLADLVATVLA